MPDITNPQALAFVRDRIRPLCEKARALNAEIDDMTTAWFAGINVMFPNDSSPVQDGREAEGVSRLTGANINSAAGNLIDTAATINEQIIALPCVNPLRAG